MKGFLLLVFLISLSVTADDFIIASSANVQFALDDLNLEYAKLTGKPFKSIIASSGKLSSQIENGAPFSVFLSADLEYPLKLYNSGHTFGPPKIYAKGKIIIWSRKFTNLENFQTILLQPNLKHIAIANPELAPYGKETIRALIFYGIFDKIKHKLIYAESISQVNQYVISQAVDIGFTAKSILAAKKISDIGYWHELDSNAYSPIKQGVVILKYGWEQNKIECKNFYKILFSEKGKLILKRNGYIVDDL